MVPSLSSSEKLNTNGMLILTLFGFELELSSRQWDTDITLEGQDPILPRVANITFIMLEGVLKKHLPETPNLFDFLSHWNDAKAALISLLGPIVLNEPTNFYNPR